MTNRYAGRCYKCRRAVPAGTGRTWKHRGRWYVACAACDAEKRVEREGSVGGEALADPGAAALEVAQGVEEGPARRRVRRTKGAEAEAARVDLYELRASQARKAFAEGRASVYCGTCGCELEAFERGQWRERGGRCSVCSKRDAEAAAPVFGDVDPPEEVRGEDEGEFVPTTDANRQRREDARGHFRAAVLREGLAAGMLLGA